MKAPRLTFEPAQVREALEQKLKDFVPGGHFDQLCEVLDEQLDPGACLIGFLATASALSGVSTIAALEHPVLGVIYREYKAKVREAR